MDEFIQGHGQGAFVSHINQMRADELLGNLAMQDINLELALEELQIVRDFISTPEHILGSELTKHGEIAEQMAVGFDRSENFVVGKESGYTFEGVKRLAPEDYLLDGLPVQSKFYNSPSGTFSAITEHLDLYPDFISSGGTYEIPRDQFAQLLDWLNMSQESLAKLTNEEGGRAARKAVDQIRTFEAQNGVRFEDVVNPSSIDYKDAQLGVAENTINIKEGKIGSLDNEQREQFTELSKPSLTQGLQVAAIGAVLDGVISFSSAVVFKMREGKKLGEFDREDWEYIFKESAKGTLRGGLTGGGIYILTNFAGLNAFFAAGLMSATFSITVSAIRLSKDEITLEQFIDGIGDTIINAAVTGVGALAGQALIPVPVLGALIGSIIAQQLFSIIIKSVSLLEKIHIPSLQKALYMYKRNESLEKWSLSQIDLLLISVGENEMEVEYEEDKDEYEVERLCLMV